MASSSSSSCAACKFLRRKCVMACVFAPYFPPEDSEKFILMHRAFGASKVARILNELTPLGRHDAVTSLCFEAEVHLQDPVNGCVGLIQRLSRLLDNVNDRVALLESEILQLINSPAVDFLHQRPPLPINSQIFSSPQWAMSQDMVYSPHLQVLDQSFKSQQVDGERYSGSESAAGPATVLALARQQIDNSARQHHHLHDRRQQ